MAEGNDKMVDLGRINVNNVTKTFVNIDGELIRALTNISLDIKAGSFVCFIGPSGCGKSTLLRLIAGLIKADSGQIILDDNKIEEASYDRGLVFQNPTLFPWLNVYDNIAFGLRARKIYKENKGLVNEYIDLVGLKGFEKNFPHQLSGGMAQRVAIARALVGHPKVLLMDESLGALDAFTRMNMQDEILKIWKEKHMTVVMVTHDVDEAIYLSDKVVVMSPRPAKIEEIIDVKLARPRARSNPEFLRLRSEILKVLNFAGHEEEPSYYI